MRQKVNKTYIYFFVEIYIFNAMKDLITKKSKIKLLQSNLCNQILANFGNYSNNNMQNTRKIENIVW